MEFKSDVLGLALLGSISAFSIWSAANPSVFTISQFTTEQSKKNARLGMNIGLGLTGALSAGLYLAYGKKGTMPAVLTGATGIGLYALYEYMLSSTHISNPNQSTMAEQAEFMYAQGGFPSQNGGVGRTGFANQDNSGYPSAPIGRPGNRGPGGGGGGGPGAEPGAEPGGEVVTSSSSGGGGPQGSHPGPGVSGFNPQGFYYDDYGYSYQGGLTVTGGRGGAGGKGPGGVNAGGGGGGTAGGGGGPDSSGEGGEGGDSESSGSVGGPKSFGPSGGQGPGGGSGYYDFDGNYYMSKAQVKASGWPQCAGCLKHGRTLRDCSLLGECRGPWSDGATPDDLKMEQMRQLRLSGLGGGGYGDDGGYYGDDGLYAYHAGSHPHGGKPHAMMASPVSQHKYHIDEGFSDYRGRY